jgi:hypothetical protein
MLKNKAALCLFGMILLGSICRASGGKADVPEWRDTSKQYSFLGNDRFWRPRQSMVFYLVDDLGGGFDLNLRIRDMNVYQEGKRPAFVFVTAPSGAIVARKFIPDDGVEQGNPKYKDGIFDIYSDFRYREYHRKHSPGGRPPGKARSPYLDDPGRIKARDFRLNVPASEKGVYTVHVASCWDHWLSLTPSRAMPCAVYSGQGALYLHKKQLRESYLYVPRHVRDISFVISEECAPFNWKLKVSDDAGKLLANTSPKTFYNYAVWRNVAGERVIRLEAEGASSGACLHVKGAPFILSPDPKTAARLKGGYVDAAETAFDPDQLRILQWATELNVDTLKVTSTATSGNAKGIVKILATQNLDPASASFGRLKSSRDLFKLVKAISEKKPDNPFYGDPVVVKRILLALVSGKFRRWGPNGSFNANESKPLTVTPAGEPWLFRTSWWPLNDGSYASILNRLDGHLDGIEPKLIGAMKRLFEKWILARMVMEQGLCSNQWSYDLEHMAAACRFVGTETAKSVLDFQVSRFCTLNNLGRTIPDQTPYSLKSEVRHTWSADTGIIGGGVPAEIFGHDNEYCLETCANMAKVWEQVHYPEIVDWLKTYYVLKTHLTLSKTGSVPQYAFSDTCSPADFNTRTRYYTHKSGIGKIHEQIPFGALWQGKTGAESWPFLTSGSFVKTIDKRYYFVKTAGYYAILYAGPGAFPFCSWSVPTLADGSMEYTGFNGMGYGGYQYMASKPGGISALWIPECGPVILGNNHNVSYTNAVWGRMPQPIFENHAPNVDPNVVSESYDSPKTQFDASQRVMTKSGRIPDTPLTFRRRISLNDRAIKIELTLRAEKDVRFEQLHEAIPLFPDGRIITAGTTEIKLPAAIVTHSHRYSKDKKQWGLNPNIPPTEAATLSIGTADGKGVDITFGSSRRLTFSQPLKYRKEAATMSSANIALPLQWKKGDVFNFTYSISVK